MEVPDYQFILVFHLAHEGHEGAESEVDREEVFLAVSLRDELVDFFD